MSKSRDDIPMQTSLYGAILGPLWAAKGEQFNPTGAFEHFMGLAIDVKQRVKKEGESLENVSIMCAKIQLSSIFRFLRFAQQ